MRLPFIFLAGMLLAVGTASAQVAVPFKSKKDDSVRTVYIWHSDTLREVKKDSVIVQSLFGHVKIQSDKTLFYCDSLVINQKNNFMEAFGNVHINDSDTTNIYSQYMKYFVDNRQIVFTNKVSMISGKGTLFTEELHYDMNQHIGNYYKGGKVVSGKTTVTSDEGAYYADLKDMYFYKNVVMKDPAYDLTTDSLLYNTQQERATFLAMTHIRDSSGSTVDTKEGNYDTHGHRAQFGQRPTITQGSQKITANDIRIDSSGASIATGNAVFKDTAEGLVVMSNAMVADKAKGSVLATEHPVMIIKQDADSLYFTADTLFSGRLPDSVLLKQDSIRAAMRETLGQANGPTPRSDSSTRYITGYHGVRIFSDSLQAVADSMYYSGIDSVFRLYSNPIAWAGGFQVTGDTMYMSTKNKKPERLYVFENSFVVGKSGERLYNQIKSNTLTGIFRGGEIDYMHAKGSAESVYYVKDDSLNLVGVNRVTRSDVIDMYFVAKALNRIVLRQDAEGTMYPIRQVKPDDMILRGFQWLDARRPKTKFELFENAPARPPVTDERTGMKPLSP